MTSEVENIMNGQVVGNVNAGKAIGVSTANLMPDGKGEVPLSKQTSFQIGSSAMTQNPSLVTEELDLTPPSDVKLGDQSPSEVPTVTSTPVINDTISDTPVDVVAPTQLGGLDIDSIISNIPIVADEDNNKNEVEVKDEVEAEKDNVELPEMPEAILAEEPKGVNDNLFINLQSLSPSTIPSMGEVKEKVALETDSTQDVSAVESSTKVQDVNLSMPTSETNTELEKNNQEEASASLQEVKDEKDKKIDMIINKLDEISKILDDTNKKIDLMGEKNKEQIQSIVLPQESTTTVNNTVPMAETVTEKQDEMVGALSQLGNMDGLTVDETPIKGGMFI